jgi:CheY-like chemotaxis protein
MDIRMPVMDGLEASRRIRELDGGRDVKIVALTASVFEEERDHVLAAGMDDLIRKPYRSEEIFDCLERQLGVRFARQEAPPATAAAPIVTLNPEALATLPADLRHALAEALVKLDIAGFAELIPLVSEHDRALGDALTQHADRLNYTTILQALKAIKDI